jgi:hypothetical protein
MYLKIMISLSLVALAVALFVTPNASYQVFLQFLVCASAALIVWKVVRDKAQYLWAVAFCGIAIVFNPIVPLALPGRVFFVLDLLCVALFLVYARAYKAKPRWSMASVSATERSLGPSALWRDVSRTEANRTSLGES